jgi:3-oxoacyl-[acyl-carrier-protein] synthase-1
MRRVVVSGLGLVSSIGCTTAEALDALRRGKSGLVAAPGPQGSAPRSGVCAPVKGWDQKGVPKRARQTMSTAAMYAAAAGSDALADAGLDGKELDPTRAGVVVGTVFGGIGELSKMHQYLTAGKKTRAGVVGVVKAMNSTASGNLAAMLGFKGRAYSLSTSFASGTDCIGHAFELVQRGVLDVVLCGATEEECWSQIGPYFENLGLTPMEEVGDPEKACRPYDVERRGMVMSAGAGVLVLEPLDQARRRAARVYGEIVAYGSSNDGHDMFSPSGRGLARALEQALAGAARNGVDELGYVNTHGTGTRVGDAVEAAVLREVIGASPLVSSTKGLTGHALGAAGALEAVYTLLMMANRFVAPTANLEEIDPECGGLRHVRHVSEVELQSAMSFSVGLGGTNSCVVWRSPPRG